MASGLLLLFFASTSVFDQIKNERSTINSQLNKRIGAIVMEAKAAVIYEQGGSFVIEDIELDDPREDEVLVRIEASGVCHTDSIAQGLVDLPAVFGHEGVGVVEKLGGQSDYLSVGDRVIISFPWCGRCSNCTANRTYWCDDAYPMLFGGARADGSKTIKVNDEPISSAFFQQSSFATHAITLVRDTIKVTDNHLGPEMLAALPCGVLTGAGSIFNELKLKKTHSLVIFGAGAVGLSALMAAKVIGCKDVVCIDIVEDRLKLAKELGASETINASKEDVKKKVLEDFDGGVDYVLETSGAHASFETSLFIVKTGGTIGAVTFPNYGSTFEVPGEIIVARGIHLTGIRLGSSRAEELLPYLLELNSEGVFPFEKIISHYKFSDINLAIADAHNGSAVKPVLLM